MKPVDDVRQKNKDKTYDPSSVTAGTAAVAAPGLLICSEP